MGLKELYDAFRFSPLGNKLDNSKRDWDVWVPSELHLPCIKCGEKSNKMAYFENRAEKIETYCHACYVAQFEYPKKA